jgi:hypothetical protein
MENKIQWRVDGTPLGTGETNGNCMLSWTELRLPLHLTFTSISVTTELLLITQFLLNGFFCADLFVHVTMLNNITRSICKESFVNAS